MTEPPICGPSSAGHPAMGAADLQGRGYWTALSSCHSVDDEFADTRHCDASINDTPLSTMFEAVSR